MIKPPSQSPSDSLGRYPFKKTLNNKYNPTPPPPPPMAFDTLAKRFHTQLRRNYPHQQNILSHKTYLALTKNLRISPRQSLSCKCESRISRCILFSIVGGVYDYVYSSLHLSLHLSLCTFHARCQITKRGLRIFITRLASRELKKESVTTDTLGGIGSIRINADMESGFSSDRWRVVKEFV